MLVEEGVYGQMAGIQEICCDVGRVATLSSNREFNTDASIFAYKLYRYPPSAFQPCFSDSFDLLFSRLSDSKVPLFVDSSLPEERMLVLGSPYRHCGFEERTLGKQINEANFNPGAYQDEGRLGHSSSDSEGDEWILLKPDRTQSSLEEFRMQADPVQAALSPAKFEDRRRVSKELDALPIKPQVIHPTLIDNLNTRIKYHRSAIAPLSQAELKGYDRAGEYVYSAGLPPLEGLITIGSNKRSLTTVPEKVEMMGSSGEKEGEEEGEEKKEEEGFATRVKRRRPPLLTVKVPPPLYSKDRDYLTHLANLPDHWETSGLPKLFTSLIKHPCRVLFSNMSAASAVNEVRAFKEKEGMDVAVETCPHYLYFCMEEVEEGDTRLKTFPPIRNKTNCNLLWELLKVKCIDLISSHHCPTLPSLKFLPTGNFKRALSGIVSIGCSLPAVWTKLRMPSVDSHVRERYIVRLAKWMSLAPARFLGIASKRGSIERGKFADLIIWRPHTAIEMDGRWLKYSELSPYTGKRMYGEIRCVFVRGKLAFGEGGVREVGKVCERREML